jgi:hypothetical protein
VAEDFRKAQERFLDQINLLGKDAEMSLERAIEHFRRIAPDAAFTPEQIEHLVATARQRAGKIMQFPKNRSDEE